MCILLFIKIVDVDFGNPIMEKNISGFVVCGWINIAYFILVVMWMLAMVIRL